MMVFEAVTEQPRAKPWLLDEGQSSAPYLRVHNTPVLVLQLLLHLYAYYRCL